MKISRVEYYSKVNSIKITLIDVNSLLEKLLSSIDERLFPEQAEKINSAMDILEGVNFLSWKELTNEETNT